MGTSKKKQNRKKRRKIEYLETIEKRYYIFCEGEKTEPNYFDAMREAIRCNPIYKNIVYIETVGLGKETLRVINFAEKYVEKNNIKNADIWCVYDKDSFPDDDFNAVSIKANTLNQAQNDNKYNVAWSNQCIEYWFILHFTPYPSNNDRKDYISFLNTEFKKKGLGKYRKNSKDIFEILNSHGNPKLAIKYSENQLKCFCGLSDAKSAPATKVHILVKELAKYFPESLKNKYLDKKKTKDKDNNKS